MCLLTIIPRKIRPWIRGLFCVIAYITTIVDVFCWEKFQSTLNPSMLLLVGETDGREASEFFNSYFSTDLIFSGVGLILLIMLIHILATILPGIIKKRCSPLRLSLNSRMKDILEATTGGLCLILLPWSVCSSAHNKVEMIQMFSMETIGSVEHELTTKDCAQFYLPVYRLAFSIFSNELASQQIGRLIEAKDKMQVDSCSFTSPKHCSYHRWKLWQASLAAVWLLHANDSTPDKTAENRFISTFQWCRITMEPDQFRV